MTKYVAECRIARADTITASRDETNVHLDPTGDNVFLYPDKAREFARAVLAIADEIDGGEVAESVRVGDRIRILVDSAECAMVSVGDEFIVANVEQRRGGGYWVAVDDGEGDGGRWHFGEETSWEKVTPVASVDEAPVAPDRMALLEEARKFVGHYDIGHTLDVAKFLAGEGA